MAISVNLEAAADRMGINGKARLKLKPLHLADGVKTGGLSFRVSANINLPETPSAA